MNSNIGLPILIGAVVITALLAGGIAYMVGNFEQRLTKAAG